MVTGQPRLRTTAFQVFDGVLVMVATATSGTGAPKMYRVTQGLKAESFDLVELTGAQGQNRTADTGIFRASKINNLLISLKQGFFGTIGDSYVDSVG